MPIDTLASYHKDRESLYAEPLAPTIQKTCSLVQQQREIDTLESLQPSQAFLSALEPKTSVLAIVVKGIAAALAVSAGLAGLGALVSWLGNSAITLVSRAGWRLKEVAALNAAVQFLARVLTRSSKALFLTLTVPPYMFFFQLPRWLIQEAFPSFLLFVRPLMTRCYELSLEVAKSFLRKMDQLVAIIVDKVQVFVELMEHVLGPVKNWMIGLSKAIQESAQWCLDQMEAATNLATKGAQAAWKEAKRAAVAVGKALRPYAVALYHEIVQVSTWIGQGLMTVWRIAEPGLAWSSRQVIKGFSAASSLVRHSVSLVKNIVGPVFSWIGRGCRQTAAWMGQGISYVISGAASVLAAIASAVRWIQPLVTSFVDVVRQKADWLSKALPQAAELLGNALLKGSHWLANSLFQGVKSVVGPESALVRATKATATAVRNAIVSFFSKLLQLVRT